MENEKNKVATQVAQGVSTKTKILLVTIMGVAVIGMAFFMVAIYRTPKKPVDPREKVIIETCDINEDDCVGSRKSAVVTVGELDLYCECNDLWGDDSNMCVPPTQNSDGEWTCSEGWTCCNLGAQANTK